MTTYHHQTAIGHYNRQQAGGNFHLAQSPDIPNQNPVQLAMTVKERGGKKSCTGKSPYRHVPHSQKPPQVVERRNARERRRVEAVNDAFLRLRKRVPCHSKQKRLSKVKTLRVAIDYIKQLQSMLHDHDNATVALRRKVVSESNTAGQENCMSNPRTVNENNMNSIQMQQQQQTLPWEFQENCAPQQVPFPIACTSDQSDMAVSLPEYGCLRMHEITNLPDM